MKVLVTGSNGLVGKAIQEVSNYPDYSGINYIFSTRQQGDLIRYSSTYDLIHYHKPDVVVNLAANVGGLFKNMKQPVEMFEDNMMINMNVLKACKNSGVKKVINMLSTCIFPDEVKYPICEIDIHNGPPHYSNEGYAYAKRMVDVLGRCYKKEYGIEVMNIIPTNIYGKHDNFNIEHGHVIPSLIHKFYLAKKNNERVKIKGSGKPLRQFIYANDLARVILDTITYDIKFDRLIVAPDETGEISIDELVRLIAKIFDYDNYYYDGSADGQYRKTASNKLLMRKIPFGMSEYEKGLYETINWFIDNYKSIRK